MINFMAILVFLTISLSSYADCLKELQKIKTIDNDKQAFVTCLSEYVRIPTPGTTGQEYKSRIFFEKVFKGLQIPFTTIWSPDPYVTKKPRYNIVASLTPDNRPSFQWRSAPKNKSIILLNHIDVVDVHPDQWENPSLTYSGKIKDGFVWGRGSLDMKGIAIMQLVSMVKAKYSKEPRTHDIHFMAVADEETNGTGAVEVIKQIQPGGALFALSNAKIVLNEGGGGLYIPKLKTNLFAIDTEQKGGAWLTIKNTNYNDLLYHLAVWHILEIKDLNAPYRVRAGDIKIVKFETPKAKVNVQASKFHIWLKGEPTQLMLLSQRTKNLIKKHYPQIALVVKQLTPKGDKVELDFSLPSSSHGSLKKGLTLLEKVVSLFYSQGVLQTQRLSLASQTTEPKFFSANKTSATKEFLKQVGKKNLGLKLFNSISFIKPLGDLLLNQVAKAIGISHAFKTSCNLTSLSQVKNHYEAYVDCRVAHTHKEPENLKHIDLFINQLQEHIPYLSSVIEAQTHWNFSRSSDLNPYLKKLMKEFRQIYPKSIVTPYLNIAGSDSKWFRSPRLTGNNYIKPIPAYGFSPFIYSQGIVDTIHGSNERFPINQAKSSVESLFKILQVIAR